MLVKVTLARLLIREMADSQFVTLQEEGGDRMFPIAIGLPEAFAIERRLRKTLIPRPQTHDLLGNVIDLFTERYLKRLEADRDRCDDLLDQSLALVTALVPVIGYDKSAELAKRAYAEGKTIRELLMAEKLLPEDEVERLLDPARMTEPTE